MFKPSSAADCMSESGVKRDNVAINCSWCRASRLLLESALINIICIRHISPGYHLSQTTPAIFLDYSLSHLCDVSIAVNHVTLNTQRDGICSSLFSSLLFSSLAFSSLLFSSLLFSSPLLSSPLLSSPLSLSLYSMPLHKTKISIHLFAIRPVPCLSQFVMNYVYAYYEGLRRCPLRCTKSKTPPQRPTRRDTSRIVNATQYSTPIATYPHSTARVAHKKGFHEYAVLLPPHVCSHLWRRASWSTNKSSPLRRKLAAGPSRSSPRTTATLARSRVQRPQLHPCITMPHHSPQVPPCVARTPAPPQRQFSCRHGATRSFMRRTGSSSVSKSGVSGPT